jgi:hypothetical protein
VDRGKIGVELERESGIEVEDAVREKARAGDVALGGGLLRWAGGRGVAHKMRSVYAGARRRSSVVLP